MNWEQVFGNLDKVSTDTLKKLKSNLKDFISAQKDLSPENLKELVDAIERIDDKVSERNPFEAMSTSFKSLKTATDAEREAQEAYNKALKEDTDEEKKNAKATLESAKNTSRKPCRRLPLHCIKAWMKSVGMSKLAIRLSALWKHLG